MPGLRASSAERLPQAARDRGLGEQLRVAGLVEGLLRDDVLALAEPPGLAEAKLSYWYAAYGCIAAALALDTLRWCGCCSGVTEAVLGYLTRPRRRNVNVDSEPVGGLGG